MINEKLLTLVGASFALKIYYLSTTLSLFSHENRIPNLT